MNLTKDSQSQLNSSKQSSKPQLSGISSSSPSFSRSEDPSLGNTTGFASTLATIDLQKSLTNQLENTSEKYRLQRIAKKYHPNSRLSACMSSIAPQAEHISLHYHDENRHAHYRGLMRCDDVWKCPVCSSRITSRRADEIRQAYSYAVDTLKYRVVMVTYTMSHSQFDSLQKNLDNLRDARRKMRSGRKWQKFGKDYGYVGSISALEVTYAEKRHNGWHVHVHEIMFLDPENSVLDLSVSDDAMDKWLDTDLSQWWIDSLKKVNRSASLTQGIDVTSSDKYVAEYVAKYGKLPARETWDIALEIAKSNSKKASDGLHPFTILDRSDNPAIEENDRKKYRALWHEYTEAFHGRKQIFWKNGLKDLLLVDVAEDDSDIEEAGQSVIGISRDAWRAVRYLNKQADLLNYTTVCRGKVANIERYVKTIIRDANKKMKVSEYWKEFHDD